MKHFLATIIVIMLLPLSNLSTQDVKVETRVDTNKILIGDQINLHLKVTTKPPTEIILPELKDSLGKFEIVEIGKVDTQRTKDELVLNRKVTLTIFDSGYYFIPSLNILYLKKDLNQYASVQSDTIPIYIKGIQVDTTKEFKDIKGIIEVPYTIWDYLPYILIGIGILGVAYIVYSLLRKRKKTIELAEELKLPPHIVALKELRQLDAEKLWQKGEVKQFHIRLTGIVRKYIERRFEIPALEMISSEIIDGLSKLDEIDANLIQKLRRSFEISDLVKFAKFLPLPDENAYCLQVAFEFVESTAPKEVVQQSDETK